jgi:hypothetical protein
MKQLAHDITPRTLVAMGFTVVADGPSQGAQQTFEKGPLTVRLRGLDSIFVSNEATDWAVSFTGNTPASMVLAVIQQAVTEWLLDGEA